MKLITSASVVAAALSFGPTAYGRNQSSDNSSTNSQTAVGQAAYGASSPAPQTGAISGGASRYGAKDRGAGQGLRVASSQAGDRTADQYDDAQVRGSGGQDLGQIRDFLVSPQSGQVCFAVVSSGGWAGIGDTLRLVPFDALQRDNGSDNGFTVALSQSQWRNAPAISEDKFEEGRVTLQPQQQQQLQQTFASSQMASQANSNTQLLRASKVRGLDVTAQGQDIGSVEGVVVQPGQTQALALLDPDDDFAGGEQKFLVPLSDLNLSGNGSANTNLTREDFRSAAPSNESGATASNDNPNASSQRLSQNTAMDASSGTAAGNFAPGSAPAFASTGGATPAANGSSTSVSGTGTNTASTDNSTNASDSGYASNNGSMSASTTGTGTANASGNSKSGYASNGSSSMATNTASSGFDHDTANATSASDSNANSATANAGYASNSGTQTSSADAGNGVNGSAATETSGHNAGPHVALPANAPSPTGYTSAQQVPTTTQKLLNGAQAIRRALDGNAQTARENVTIIPENGKITLRGNVSSDELKAQIENMAYEAGQPNVVVSYLTTNR